METEWFEIASIGGLASVLPYLGVALADWIRAHPCRCATGHMAPK